MNKKPSTTVQTESGNVDSSGDLRNRFPAYIKLVPNTKGPASHMLEFAGTEIRHHDTPLTDGGGGNPERPRDIRGSLKVFKNVLLEHDSDLTAVYLKMQPRLHSDGLTSVNMTGAHTTLGEAADRFQKAMKTTRATRKQIAKACGVSLATVGYWFNGQKLISHDNAKCAAKILRVSAAYLRVESNDPKESQNEGQAEADAVFEALREMKEPLMRMQQIQTALLAALERLEASRAPERKRG